MARGHQGYNRRGGCGRSLAGLKKAEHGTDEEKGSGDDHEPPAARRPLRQIESFSDISSGGTASPEGGREGVHDLFRRGASSLGGRRQDHFPAAGKEDPGHGDDFLISQDSEKEHRTAAGEEIVKGCDEGGGRGRGVCAVEKEGRSSGTVFAAPRPAGARGIGVPP